MRTKIYLDTSVPSAYFDSEKSERQQLTREFWPRLRKHDIFISEITTLELEQTMSEILKRKLLNICKGFSILKLSKNVGILAEKYIEAKAVPERFIDDAYHIAIAVINEMDYLISWNFKHMVNMQTKEVVNTVNSRMGYKRIEIIAPQEL